MRPLLQRLLLCLGIGLVLGLLPGFSGALPAGAFEAGPFVSEHLRSHPLVGDIVDGTGAPVAAQALEAAVRGARFVALGETHTNPDHHRLQAELLDVRAEAGDHPALVFEMIPEGLQGAVDAYLGGGGTAAGFGTAVQWTERGWPDFATYRPIIDVALAQDLPIRAGDLDRALMRRVSKEGAGALGEARMRRFGMDRDLKDAARADLAEELALSHCGMLPPTAIAPMIQVQRARDGALAAAMAGTGAGAPSGAVLIAGAGHVRRDRAVPAVLGAMEPGAGILAIAFVEVEAGRERAEDYDVSLYDFTVFTPRFDVSDPCEGMKTPG